MTIPLGKGIAIPRNKRWWNGIHVPILLFGNNSHILIGIKKKLLKKPYNFLVFPLWTREMLVGGNDVILICKDYIFI
jgi:hypothetical protein